MKVILYKTNIEKNHVIESIEDYLETCDNVIPNVSNLVNRGIKSRDLRVSMKIPFIDDVGMNYLKAYDDDNILYYFINNIEWLNDGTSLLDLELDTLNTYQTYVLDSKNYKKLSVKRWMKDRFKNVTYTFDKTTGKNKIYAERDFDKVDEGLNDVNYYAKDFTSIKTTPSYIAYQVPTTSDSGTVTNYTSKVRKLFIPKETTTLDMTQYTETFYSTATPVTVGTGRKLIINPDGLILKVQHDTNKYKIYHCDAFMMRVTITSSSTPGFTYYFYFFTYSQDVLTCIDIKTFSVLNSFQYMSNGDGIYYNDWNSTEDFPTISKTTNYLASDLVRTSTKTTCPSSTVSKTIYGIDYFNKSDSQLKQITEIPFTPSSDNLVFMGDLENITEVEFRPNEVVSYSTNRSISYLSRVELTDYDYHSLRNSEMESKLYGSYVRNLTFQYDNNCWVIQPEYYNTSKYGIIPISMVASLNMDDNLGFKFDNFNLKSTYSNWLLCSRNNQLIIYNNDYLEYMRSGYNYDKKNKAIQSVKNWTNLAFDATSGAGKIVENSAKGNVGGIISSSAGIAKGISNSIISEFNNNLALEKKKNSVLNANVTVAGSDSLALFHQYSGNELKLIELKPNDETLNNIYNLFYYFGYASNRYYPEGFSLKSRQYFDYYQIDIEYLKPSLTISQNIIKDIQNKFKDGITFEWKYNNTWLCNGTLYENWETSLNLNE